MISGWVLCGHRQYLPTNSHGAAKYRHPLEKWRGIGSWNTSSSLALRETEAQLDHQGSAERARQSASSCAYGSSGHRNGWNVVGREKRKSSKRISEVGRKGERVPGNKRSSNQQSECIGQSRSRIEWMMEGRRTRGWGDISIQCEFSKHS